MLNQNQIIHLFIEMYVIIERKPFCFTDQNTSTIHGTFTITPLIRFI